ncbi:NAD(P)/FAD-dependent oxidoreductase [Hyalangium rubrum]|uniref:FAD-dependent oxidoreductase n=1 Tax=Hyalangium rubrum TaxID=3103134 RepID=A0ABU5GXR1_9BACT|nr:FAD-dependent oxidoreductase [Hyalangium sp. s54d21]MDY7225654.1 FAD-dependent oxidoreductase [Hyalangium sp. s54d21]
MRDVIILGAGPAGLSAALWCDDLGLDALLLERGQEPGGQLPWVHNPIGNYLGLEAANGSELREKFTAQLARKNLSPRTGVEVERVDLKTKQVRLASGEVLEARSLILATGLRRRRLGIPGEAELMGHGVLGSGRTERFSVAGESVCVVGGGDAAVENALLFAEVCPAVTLIHRGPRLTARREFLERLAAEPRIQVFTKAVLERVIGSQHVEAVEVRHGEARELLRLAVRNVLVRIGFEPNSELFAGQLRTDSHGYIAVNLEQETDVENVFAVGDVSNPRAPTVSSATGAGATAAKVIASRLNSGL